MTLIKIQEPKVLINHTVARFALWRLGFRPFYIMAALFACLAILAWGIQFLGWLNLSPKIDIFWHAHEMAFGFAIAVVIGFLYTAARNWTGLDTPVQGKLIGIVLCWLAARFAMLLLPPWMVMWIDGAFLPIAILPLAQVIIKKRSQRNYGLLLILMMLALLNMGYHLARVGWVFVSPLLFIHAAILLIVVIASIIAGRVIPSFTANAVPMSQPVIKAWQTQWGIGLLILGGAAWLLHLSAWLVFPLCLAAAMVQSMRCLGWKPFKTRHNPLLWILHLAYAWIPLGLTFMALSSLGWVSQSVVIHTFTVGGLAGLMIAMMTRTALGHTGRMLKAGRMEVVMYGCISLAALSRISAGLLTGSSATLLIILSMLAWIIGFALYLWRYAPYLYHARIDGKEG